jgi:hypothetical protein
LSRKKKRFGWAGTFGVVEQLGEAAEHHMSKPNDRALGRDDLIASSYTLSGAPVFEPPRFSFAERVAAAAKAGFAGIGIAIEDYAACRERLDVWCRNAHNPR